MWAKVLPPVSHQARNADPSFLYRGLLKCSLSDPSPGTNLRFYPGANWPQQQVQGSSGLLSIEPGPPQKPPPPGPR